MNYWKSIKEYVFIPSGETVRALEITAITEVVNIAYKTDLATVTNWKSWAISLAVGVATAVIAAAKGKIH